MRPALKRLHVRLFQEPLHQFQVYRLSSLAAGQQQYSAAEFGGLEYAIAFYVTGSRLGRTGENNAQVLLRLQFNDTPFHLIGVRVRVLPSENVAL